MFTKNLFKHLLLLVTFLFVLGSISIAQQRTYYVDNQIGSNGYNGLTQTVTGASAGPKATIMNAIAAANDGDIILVNNTGVPYVEDVTFQDGGPSSKLLLTLGSYNGTPVVTGILIVNNTYGNPALRSLTVTGPIQFSNGLTLTKGNIVGAGNLTIGGTITRADSGSVDAQILLTGTSVNYAYNLTAVPITTGNELPSAAATTKVGTFTTTGTIKVILNRNITVSGAMSLASGVQFNLNGYTISTSSNITAADTITNGTITETATTGTPSFAATNVLPNITLSGASTLSVASASVGSLSASTGSITATLSGGTAATAAAASIRGSVTNSGTGAITLNRSAGTDTLYVSGDLALSGTGSIATGTAAKYVVGGAVNLTTQNIAMSATAPVTGKALISFGNNPTTIVGAVSNSASLTGAVGSSTSTQLDSVIANITFAAADKLVSVGPISNTSSTSAVTLGASTCKLYNCGNITFAYTGGTGGNNFTAGTVTNNANVTIGVGCGNIIFGIMTSTGTVTSTATAANAIVTLGAVTNSSTIATIPTTVSWTSSKGTNGLIDFGSSGAAATTAASVSLTGGFTGDIQFGKGSITVTGALSNAATQKYANILFGAVTADTVFTSTFTAGSISITGMGRIVVASINQGLFKVNGSVTISGTAATADSALIVDRLSTGNLNIGSLSVTKGWMEITGTGTTTIGGTSITGGSVLVPTGTASLSNLTLSSGVLDLSTGDPTTGITVSNFNVTGGTLYLGSGTRTLTVNGQTNTFGGASAFTTIRKNSGSATPVATTLLIANSVQGQIVWTIGASTPTWPGSLTVNNSTIVQVAPIATVFTGGNLSLTSATGKVYFQNGIVQLNGTKLYINSSTGTDDFKNDAGYQTINNGYVSMANGAGNPQISGTSGTFADFEVNSTAGTLTVTATGKFMSNFYLTNGQISGSGLIFNNQTPYPTIIRNAGTFTAPPTWNSRVNITYIGTDKSAGMEVPTDSLYNLTVATTNGGNATASATSGKGTASRGVVTINSGKVNGALTVSAGQVLALATGQTLTLNGPTAQIDGDVVNLVTGTGLSLTSKTGTVISGAGLLPPITVVHQSVGNVINGTRAIVDVQLGTGDYTIGGGNDVITGTKSVANGTITLGSSGTDTTGLSTTFAAIADTGSNAGAISIQGNGANLIIHGNVVVDQTVTHAAGTINIPTATDTLIILGRGAVTHNVTTGSKITGAGVLEFAPHYFSNTLALLSGRDTIGVNVLVNGKLGLLSTSTSGLLLNGTLTLTGGANGIAIGADTLIAGGNVTMGTGTAFSGTGVLMLNAITAPLTFTYSGAASIAKLAISNDVNLAGTGTSLTAATFLHTGGVLNFGDRNLTVTGTYTRTGSASYLAGAGYFVDSCATSFNQGTTALTIPNFSLRQDIATSSFAGTGVITVSQNLDIQNQGTLTISSGSPIVNHLSVASGATVIYTRGVFNATPNYLGTISLTAKADTTIPKIIVPGVPTTLITTLTVSPGAGKVSALDTSYTINNTLTLTSGTLRVPATRVLTYADGLTVNGNGGQIDLITGSPNASMAYGTVGTVNVVYAGADTTRVELPATVNNFTITRLTDVVNSTLVLGKAVTVNGILAIRNDFTTAGSNTVTAKGNVTVARDVAFSKNTSPSCNFGSALTFNGVTGQTMTVPTGATVSNMTVNLVGTTPVPVLNISGGQLIVSNTLTMNNGDISADTALQLGTSSAVGTLSRSAGTIYNSMYQTMNLSSGTTTYKFPVGTATSYRPVTLTHTGTANVFQIVRVSVVNSAPVGTVGLPITVGSVTINAISPLYWTIGYYNSANNNLLVPSTLPTVEFGISGITYADTSKVKSLYRFTDPANAWRAAATVISQFTDQNGISQLVIDQSGVTAWASEPKLVMAIGYQSTLNNTVSGTVTYASTAAYPIGNVTVTLTPTTGTALTTTSATTTGAYSFASVTAGTYTLTASKTGNWGGVTSTDALLVALNAVTPTYTGLVFKAADVNSSGTVTSTDALLIQLRAVSGTTTNYTAGDWAFTPAQTVTVASSNVTANISGLAVGDVNASYNPSPATAFAKAPAVNVEKGAREIKIYSSAPMKVGALTLRFNSDNIASITSQKLSGLVSKDGIMGWYNTNGVQFKQNELIATATLKQPDKGSNIGMQYEIADPNGDVMNTALEVSAKNIPDVFALSQNYPNPFNPSTQIEYSLPNSGMVTLSVYNLLGQEVARLVNEQKEAGTYTVQWAPRNLASGVYIYRIHVQTEKESVTSVKRLTLLK
ncbi:MAG: T9SS type A sorting domain-containing protein [Bacteroidota bacterium]